MPKKKSLTASATAKVRTADQQALRFSKAVRDAMRLADRFGDVEADEYVLPVPQVDSPDKGTDIPDPFGGQIAYSRL